MYQDTLSIMVSNVMGNGYGNRVVWNNMEIDLW